MPSYFHKICPESGCRFEVFVLDDGEHHSLLPRICPCCPTSVELTELEPTESRVFINGLVTRPIL